MAKKPGAPAPAAGEPSAVAATSEGAATVSTATLGLVRSFALRVPIADDKGNVYPVLIVHEPEQHHFATMQRAGKGVAGSFALLAALTGVPVSAIQALRHRDHNPIKGWIEELVDGHDGDLVPDPEAAGEQTWDCELLAPIPTNAAPVTRVTVREPTIGSGIACERMKTEAEQTAALIAQITGLDIPVVMRMKRRDVVRIERWVAPFSLAGANLSRQTRLIDELLAQMGASEDGV